MTIPEAAPAAPEPEDGEEFVVSYEQALQLAIKAQQAGNLEAAEEIYTAILRYEPNSADALHFLGLARHARGVEEEGLELVRRSLELVPQSAGFWNNYGNILFNSGKLDDATDAFQRCTEIDPEFADAYCNLGILQRARNNMEIAEACYLRAIELRPESADAYTNFANLRMTQGRMAEAIELGLRSFTLRPENSGSRRLLGNAYARLGELDKARKIYDDWLEAEPGNPIAEHSLMALGGTPPPIRASNAYIQTVFDSFAVSFDSKLAQLDYCAPELVGREIARHYGEAYGTLLILDAGCGTGLCGPYLRAYAKTLAGVDLSIRMLDMAKARGNYDELHHAELTGFLQNHAAAFDAVVSADTLCYFGELEEVTLAAASCLKAGGLLVFTVEESVAKPDSFELFRHGRYGHGEAYLQTSLAAAGFRLETLARQQLRMEAGLPVNGFIVSALKTG